MYLIAAETSKVKQILKGHTGAVFRVCYSPDGRLLATSSRDKTIRLWNTTDWKTVATLEGHDDEVRCLAFSPDGRLLVSGDTKGIMSIWDVESRELLESHEYLDHLGTPCTLFDLAVAPDNTTIASSGRFVSLLDSQSGDHQRISSSVYAGGVVPFSLDGRLLAAADRHESAHIWTLDLEPHLVLKGHANTVTAIAFCQDEKIIATGSRDRTIRLWDATTGRLRMVLSDRVG